MKGIEADRELTLQLIVTGAHLAPKFGETYKVIEEDGFTIDERIDIESGGDTPAQVSKSMGLAVIGMAGAYERLEPDILVLLGDRFEMLAAAQAAVVALLPIAHIHGGEATEGAMDEAFRHAITKMAHLHFVSTGEYRDRVIQLGEAPERVFNVGAPGLDNVFNLRLLGLSELERSIGFALDKDYFLITYHPVTLGGGDPAQAVEELISALESFPDHKVIVTGTNADPGHDRITGAWNDYAASNPGRVSLNAERVPGTAPLSQSHETCRRRHRKFVQRHHRGAGDGSADRQPRRPPTGPGAGRLGHRLRRDGQRHRRSSYQSPIRGFFKDRGGRGQPLRNRRCLEAHLGYPQGRGPVGCIDETVSRHSGAGMKIIDCARALLASDGDA